MSFSVKKNAIMLTRGDTFKGRVSITTPDGSEYVPESGDRIRFAMKRDYNDLDVLIEKDIPIDTMMLVLESSDTKPFAFGDYVYDIQITKANGDVDTFITKSRITLTEEVK